MSKLHITEAKVLRMAGDLTAALTVIQYAADLYEKQATSVSANASTTPHLVIPAINNTPAANDICLTTDLTLASDKDVQSSSSSSSIFEVISLFLPIAVVSTVRFVRTTFFIQHLFQ